MLADARLQFGAYRQAPDTLWPQHASTWPQLGLNTPQLGLNTPQLGSQLTTDTSFLLLKTNGFLMFFNFSFFSLLLPLMAIHQSFWTSWRRLGAQLRHLGRFKTPQVRLKTRQVRLKFASRRLKLA